MRVRATATLTCAFAMLALATACQTSARIAFVNPTDQPLFVQVNEHAAFEVPARSAATARMPSLGRLQPMTVIARDAHGAMVFSLATSLPRIEADGNRVELKATGERIDPYGKPYPGLPTYN